MYAQFLKTLNVITFSLQKLTVYAKIGGGQGTIWCNPPYGRELNKWVKKAYETAQQGETVVMLLPARTDTKWFHEYIYGKAEIRFIKGRLKFGGNKNAAPFPSMVIIFKEE